MTNAHLFDNGKRTATEDGTPITRMHCSTAAEDPTFASSRVTPLRKVWRACVWRASVGRVGRSDVDVWLGQGILEEIKIKEIFSRRYSIGAHMDIRYNTENNKNQLPHILRFPSLIPMLPTCQKIWFDSLDAIYTNTMTNERQMIHWPVSNKQLIKILTTSNTPTAYGRMPFIVAVVNC